MTVKGDNVMIAGELSLSQQTLTVQQALELAVQHHNAGDLPKAEGIYQEVLKAKMLP